MKQKRLAFALAMLFTSIELAPQVAADEPAKKGTLAQIQNLGIPASLQTEAKQAQKDGKRLFIWREETKPIEETTAFGQQLLIVDVKYARLFSDDHAPFSLYFYTAATAKDGKQVTTYGTETDGPAKTDRTGAVSIWFISPKDKLSGTGLGYAFGVEPRKEKSKSDELRKSSEAISNEIKVSIKFKNE